MIIGIISQKGGVSKSVLCRLLCRDFIDSGMSASIADMDSHQSTCFEWAKVRNRAGIKPYIPVQKYSQVRAAVEKSNTDVLIIDGAPNSDRQTRQIAQAADLIIIPTGTTNDDRRPSIRLHGELIASGIPKNKIIFVLCRVTGTAKSTVANAYFELVDAGYQVLKGAMRQQAGYALAFDQGKTATETLHKSLNVEAAEIAQYIADKLEGLINNESV